MNQSHRGSSIRSSRRHPQIPYTADTLHRYSIVSSGGWEGNRDDTRVRLSHNVRAHTAALAAVRPVDRLTRGQIQSRALQIWLISELLFLMHACAVRWPVSGPPSLSFSLSPRITRCLNACSSARPPLTRRSKVSAVPPALARAAVGDAVPSARQCPRPWLALYETLSRARAAGLHPSFQPRSSSKPSLRPLPRSLVNGPTSSCSSARPRLRTARTPVRACARPRLRLRLAPYRSTPCGRSRVAASPVLR
jgi:hypothetical protein